MRRGEEINGFGKRVGPITCSAIGAAAQSGFSPTQWDVKSRDISLVGLCQCINAELPLKPGTGMTLRVSTPDIFTAGEPPLENLRWKTSADSCTIMVPTPPQPVFPKPTNTGSSPRGPSFLLGGNVRNGAIGREFPVAGETDRQPEAVMGLSGSNPTLSIPALPPAPNKVARLDHRPRRSQTSSSFQVTWVHAGGVFPGRATALYLASPNLIPHPSL